jgi:hypothetical protein
MSNFRRVAARPQAHTGVCHDRSVGLFRLNRCVTLLVGREPIPVS